MFGVFEGDNSRTKIFIKNEKMKLESLEDTRLDGVYSLHMFPPFFIYLKFMSDIILDRAYCIDINCVFFMENFKRLNQLKTFRCRKYRGSL